MMLPAKNRPDDLEPIQKKPKRTKISKALSKAALAALLVTAATLGLFLFWSFQSVNPLSILNDPFPTRSIRATPAANGVIILDIEYCKNVNKSGRVRISFVSDSTETFLPLQRDVFRFGCQKEEVPIIIPKNLVEGDYMIKFYAEYDINPVQKNQETTFQSQPFFVGTTEGDEPRTLPGDTDD